MPVVTYTRIAHYLFSTQVRKDQSEEDRHGDNTPHHYTSIQGQYGNHYDISTQQWGVQQYSNT